MKLRRRTPRLTPRQTAALQAVAYACYGGEAADVEAVLMVPRYFARCRVIREVAAADFLRLLGELEAAELVVRSEHRNVLHFGLTPAGRRCGLVEQIR